MTLEENIRAILECNFSIAREEVIESAKTRIMEQISRQNPLEDELEKVKNRIDYVRNCGMGKNKSLEYIEKYINKEISELKGEQE